MRELVAAQARIEDLQKIINTVPNFSKRRLEIPPSTEVRNTSFFSDFQENDENPSDFLAKGAAGMQQ